MLLLTTNLRPHIKLYHTIVPCRWCWDGVTNCDWGSGVFIWMDVCNDSFSPKDAELIFIFWMPTLVVSSGGVTYKRFLSLKMFKIFNNFTSKPMLPFNENLIGFEWLEACIKVVKWLIPISSNDDFLRPEFIPILGNPCLNELERLSNVSLSIYK